MAYYTFCIVRANQEKAWAACKQEMKLYHACFSPYLQLEVLGLKPAQGEHSSI